MPAKKANKPASKNTAKKTFVTKRNSVIPTAEKKNKRQGKTSACCKPD